MLYYVEAESAGLLESGALDATVAGPGGTGRIRNRLGALLDPLDPANLPALRRIHVRTGIDPLPLLSSPPYRDRLLNAAVERLLIGPDAPSLRLACGPRSPEPCTFAFGLVFGAEVVLFQDTVLAFQSDAQAAGPPEGQRVAVLGVHHSWLDPQMRALRALVSDGPGRVCEMAFSRPRRLDIAQVLHLARDDEIDRHRTLTADLERAGVPLVNPWGVSTQRADDKIKSHAVWQAGQDSPGGGIVTPRARSLPRGSSVSDVVAGLLALSDGRKAFRVVAQPLHGTEGRLVEAGCVRPGDPDLQAGRHRLVAHAVDAILPADDLLLREERGNVRALVDGERLALALRVNVAWDGDRFVAESGFAQLGADESASVASRGRGGRLMDPGDALRSLCYRVDDEWRRIALTEPQISDTLEAAAAAVRRLNTGLPEAAYLKQAGVDLVLEVDASGVTPVVLEANARPAGLAASRRLTADAGGSVQPKVTDALFRAFRMCHGERSRG